MRSVFFGGGTPSLMDPDIVAAIMSRIQHHWRSSNDFEVTLEANPGSVEAGKFRDFADAGINRISMGIQALNDIDLKRLGRIHTASEAISAFETARNIFNRVSFDLIYARQDQTVSQWRSELTQAVDMAIDHLSLYQLTIEQGTAFGDRYAVGKLRGLPDDESASDMYEATAEICQNVGLNPYEVSNYAQVGSESRHNLIYWRYGDYVGIGPGAHGRLTIQGKKYGTESWKSPEHWLEAVNSGSGEKQRFEVSPEEQSTEMLMMGLRLSEGVDKARFHQLSGKALSPEKINHLVDIGVVQDTADRICVTDQGRMVLNMVIKELLAG